MIHTDELTDFDYEILEKLSLAPITEEELVSAFPSQSAARHRIELLITCDYENRLPWGGIPVPKSDTYYIQQLNGKLELSPHGWRTLENWYLEKKKARKKLREYRFWKIGPMIISLIALIVAIISLLQSLHWIHLEKSEILPVSLNQSDFQSSTDAHSSTQPLQSP